MEKGEALNHEQRKEKNPEEIKAVVNEGEIKKNEEKLDEALEAKDVENTAGGGFFEDLKEIFCPKDPTEIDEENSPKAPLPFP